VLRHQQPPLIAVVRLRKRDEWVLPKGKLDQGETPVAAARREVLEETGHDVTVHEFLGTLVYEANGRSKIVHYWRMEASGGQTHELMHDIRAVDWLPLDAALERLSRSSERAFLANVGPQALLSFSRQPKPKTQAVRKRRRPDAAPELSPPQPARPETIAPPLAGASHDPATGEPGMEAIIAAEPAPEAAGPDVPPQMVEGDIAPQTQAPEATIDAAAPAPVVDAEPAPAAAAADRADNRRWSLARKLRDWLGLAA